MDILTAWERLRTVTQLKFEAQSAAATGWNGSGTGNVRIEDVQTGIFLFHERGMWTPKPANTSIGFTNTFRWILAPDKQRMRLEHLRFGEKNPVYLFDLICSGDGTLKSDSPHVCSEDLYSAVMEIEVKMLNLQWSICGPKKSETIAYCYS